MSIPAVPIAISGNQPQTKFWPWVALALAVGFIAVSTQSVWIDEAFMAVKARQPTLSDWWREMFEQKGSDLQMPFYMVYMWGFVKIFGLGEWALRAANIPWFAAGAAVFISVFPRPRRFAVAVVTLACPFGWYYLNEARPYTMQLAASLVVFAALYHLHSADEMGRRAERCWIAALYLGLLVQCGSSLLGVFGAMSAALSLPFLFSWKRLLELLRAHWVIHLVSCVLLAALGYYFIWSLKRAAGALDPGTPGSESLASEAARTASQFLRGRAGATDAKDLAFIGYELLGLGGLGPGRLAIRESNFAAFTPFLIPLALFGAIISWVLLEAAHGVWGNPNRKRWIGPSLAVILPVAILLLACRHLGMRAYGRHLTPVLPAILFLLSFGLWAGLTRRPGIGKWLAAALLLFNLASCLSFRFAARHEKDDYRGAVAIAQADLDQRKIVWWSADEHAAGYYHLPLSPRYSGDPSKVIRIQNAPATELVLYPAPDEIIISKPDIYDSRGAVLEYLQQHTYIKRATLQAFTVWQRKNGPE